MHLDAKGLSYKRIFYFGHKAEIKSDSEIREIVGSIKEKILSKTDCLGGTMHLFANTLTPIAFILGTCSRYFGTVQLYEYFFDKKEYAPSLTTLEIQQNL